MTRVVTAANFSAAEIENMRTAGKILASLYQDVRPHVKVGVTTRQLNDWFAREIVARGTHATYLDPDVNFPGVICISVNDMVVHGVPNEYQLQPGDVVSFDLVIDYQGMKADSAFTMLADDEEPTGAKKLLLDTTKKSLYAGINAIHGDVRTGDVGAAVEQVLDRAHLGVVRDLVGHGIGREMHMDPDVPNYGHRHTGMLVPVGNAIAIEPMATLGTWKVINDPDDPTGWGYKTRDGSLAAHFEHTVLLHDDGPEIITEGAF
jgi:methionyl aminopeptidase